MTDDLIGRAVDRLRAGRLVAFPTETVYGLGADANSPDAVARIFAAKGRPKFNPLIAHVATLKAARAQAQFTAQALLLTQRFWPGPLTIVMARDPRGSVCDLACAGLSTIGIRIPSHPIALDLLQRFGRPVAAPSANLSGRLSPTTADAVSADLGDQVDLVLDGGPCRIGVESTIIACLGDDATLLRQGGISREAIEAALGHPLAAPSGGTITAPGMLASHYAPNAGLRLEAVDLEADETGLDYEGRLGTAAALDLSPSGDLGEAAANLYRHLRRLDSGGARMIAVAPIPHHGLGAAINDRLQRAAAPR